MKIQPQNIILGMDAVLCFLEIGAAPRGSDPGPAAAGILGILLVRRAIIVTPQPIAVIVAGCVLTAIVIAGDHRLVTINEPFWVSLILIAFAVYGLWEQLERLWKK